MTYEPHKPNGTNATLSSAISSNGRPEKGKLYTVPVRCGIAVNLRQSEIITIANPSGRQVCDFWAFSSQDRFEYLSMSHCRTHLSKTIPEPSDALVTNLRRPILSILDCDQPNQHDTLIAACDHARYQQLGCTEYHDNCADNLRQALMAIDRLAPYIPDPFNLWMNVPVGSDSSLVFAPPTANPGSEISMVARMDCIVVMSACPQDITPVNGVNNKTNSLEFIVK